MMIEDFIVHNFHYRKFLELASQLSVVIFKKSDYPMEFFYQKKYSEV